ncbi:hypothetical protein CF319_g7103 [Tilletia indica]|nr:hypothetical protein CF319_g7103 [Tilletia indica]
MILSRALPGRRTALPYDRHSSDTLRQRTRLALSAKLRNNVSFSPSAKFPISIDGVDGADGVDGDDGVDGAQPAVPKRQEMLKAEICGEELVTGLKAEAGALAGLGHGKLVEAIQRSAEPGVDTIR